MKIVNRNWSRNYEALEEYEAGVSLTGSETKSLYEGRAKLDGAYVRIKEGQAWLRNMEIYRYKYNGSGEYDPMRPRRLLLHKRELLRWETKMAGEPRLTIIPISCYTKGRTIKLTIALARGRTDTKKRKLEKAAKVQRSQEQMAKEYMKKTR